MLVGKGWLRYTEVWSRSCTQLAGFSLSLGHGSRGVPSVGMHRVYDQAYYYKYMVGRGRGRGKQNKSNQMNLCKMGR